MIRSIPEIFAKRAITYLLRRYFGQYLETFTHEELSLSFNKGTGVVQKVCFKVEALNALSKEYKLPVEFIQGSIDTILVEIPWSSPFTENSIIEFKGVHLVVQPTKYAEDVALLSSMWESMTSSLQLAEECLLQKVDDAEFETPRPTDSVEMMTKAFNTVLSKMKIKFTDAFIRVESILENSNTGVALEVQIKSAECFDEAGVDAQFFKDENSSDQNSFQPSAYCVKKFILEGVELYTAQFTASTSPIVQSQLIPGSPEMPPPHSSLPIQKTEDMDLQKEPILISRINGQQQIRLKLKQTDTIIGPQVDIEINLGFVSLFFTPFQVHMLIELASGLAKPASERKNPTQCPSTAMNRPMRMEDFALIIEQVNQRPQPMMPSKSLQNCHGWSSRSLDESEEDYHLMPMENKIASEVQTVSEDFESSCSSSIGSERLSYTSSPGLHEGINVKKLPKTKASNLQNLLSDSTSELTRIYACCSTLLVIILHEDMVSTSTNQDDLLFQNSNTSKNFSFLKSRAEKYFNDLTSLTMEGLCIKDFASIREKISYLCQSNHLRFLASGVTFECSEKSSSRERLFNTILTALNFELLECIFDTVNANVFHLPTYTEIVSFQVKEPKIDKGTHSIEPCLKMKCERIDILYGQRPLKQPANKLSIELAPVSFEVDISLTDRIHSLFYQDIFSKKENDPACSLFNWRNENCIVESQRTEVSFTSRLAVVNLRFPVPDLRPLHDMERVPWWKQNLREEILIMELKDASLSFTMEKEQPYKKFVIECRDFHGLFQVSPTETALSFIRVSVDPEVEKATQDKRFDWPRLVISCIPQKTMHLLDAHFLPDTDYGPISITDILMSNINNSSEPSPFCVKSVFCGAKMKSNDAPGSNTEDDSENNQVMPAEKEKMNEFIDYVVNNSQYGFNFSLPTVNIDIADKELFDLICNRLFNDLVLWQPAPLSTVYNHHEASGFKINIPVFDLNPLKKDENYHTFCTYESNNFDDSDSDSDEESGTYYSINEYSMKHKRKPKRFADSGALTKVTFLINVEKGSLSIQTPLLDSGNNVVPGYCGKMQLFLEEGKLFFASSYKGDKNQSYVCLQSNRVSLYHNGATLIPTERRTVQPYVQTSFENSNKIIYCSEFGMPFNPGATVGCGPESTDMLSMAVHIVNDAKQQIKTFKLALCFCGTTLRHFMCPSDQLFFNQLNRFLNIKQQPISGYTPSAVIVEFHLHLVHCAVDYRPLYLPLRTILTVEHFGLSTNIAVSASSLLRVVFEEMRLFISNDLKSKSVDLKKNYVSVVETPLIELCVQVTNIEGQPQKKFDMCISSNMIHVRTCADSCQALQKLIIYLASYGDLTVQRTTSKNDNVEKMTDDAFVKNEEQVSSANADDVQNLMVEAMKDSPCPQQLSAKSECLSDFSDEEFCILEDDPGVGLLPKNREPQIRVLTRDPIRIVDNHFTIPSGKLDLLKAPKHFPEAVITHTLRQMSITWHLYGGNDFEQPKTPEKKHVRIKKDVKDNDSTPKRTSDDCSKVEINAGTNVIAFCKVTPLTKEFNVNAIHYSMENFTDKRSNHDVFNWTTNGGVNRDLSVLVQVVISKIKFQHEEYPEDSEYVSRDVLLVHDFEILDKLGSSSFNKFLFQYASTSMPKQTHSNMLVVKAVRVRPDPKHDSQECSLKISCKPLRLNLDQDTVLFVFDYLRAVTQDTSSVQPPSSPGHEAKSATCMQSSVQTRDISSPTSPTSSRNKNGSNLTFFRSFSFSPEVLIKIDYQGKRVVMDQGALAGVLMGLGQLNNSEIRLKRLSYRHGLLGSQKLLSYAVNEWFQDIKSNQLPCILGGIGPMHSFVQLFQGLKDLVWLPVMQYRKDGQIVRGLQRGASSFSTSTASACLELTTRLIGAIQGAAEVAYDMVSPGPSVTNRVQGNFPGGRRTSQPADVREGVATAYNVVKEGLGDTARTIVRVASVEHEHKGICGAVGGVLRQIPPAAVKPIILGAEAATIVLGGVKHQLVPDAHKEAMDKWRTKNN